MAKNTFQMTVELPVDFKDNAQAWDELNRYAQSQVNTQFAPKAKVQVYLASRVSGWRFWKTLTAVAQ